MLPSRDAPVDAHAAIAHLQQREQSKNPCPTVAGRRLSFADNAHVTMEGALLLFT